MSGAGIGLAEALERAAAALPGDADRIRPANGDPARLLEELDAAGAARVLAWLLVHETEDGAELAAEWAEHGGAGTEAVLAMPPDLPKAARKVLRRVRHQLRSRGVELPETPAEKVVATLPRVEESIEEALLTPLDPRGARAVILCVSNPGGGVRLFELLLDEGRGILEVRVYETGRSRARRFLREFARRDRFPAVPAPPDAARALVARVAAAQPVDRPLPRSFREWRGTVASAPEGARTPGELVREALAEAEPSPARLARVCERIRADELGPWPPPAEALQPLVEELSELAKGTLVLSAAQRREQVSGTLERSLDALFAGEQAELTARRFEESAYWYWKRGRTEEAEACLAAARAFRDGRPQENPVARTLVEVALAPLLARLEEETQEGDRPEGAVLPPEGEAPR